MQPQRPGLAAGADPELRQGQAGKGTGSDSGVWCLQMRILVRPKWVTSTEGPPQLCTLSFFSDKSCGSLDPHCLHVSFAGFHVCGSLNCWGSWSLTHSPVPARGPFLVGSFLPAQSMAGPGTDDTSTMTLSSFPFCAVFLKCCVLKFLKWIPELPRPVIVCG